MSARSLIVESMRLGQFMSDEISCALHPYGLSIQQFNVLRILRGCNGKPASLQYITSRMIHKTSNTTRIVDRLLEKNFVNRKPCLKNRRKIEISITSSEISKYNLFEKNFTIWFREEFKRKNSKNFI